MPRLILQPASNPVAARHYEDTIVRPRALAELVPHFSAAKREILTAELERVYGTRPIHVWAARPGESNNVSFELMSPNDITLFYQKGVFVSSLVVTRKAPGEDNLARYLWPPKIGEEPWSLVFFLDDFRREAIAYHDLW